MGQTEYVCPCVSVLSEVSSAGRPARSKQRPLVALDPGGLGYWEAMKGERKSGESKITPLCPDMT